MNGDNALRRRLEADLEGLNNLTAVNSAHVALQYQREATPPYQAVVMLAVPGPDIHAAARDHTGAAAWGKVMARLRQQIEERLNQRTARKKSRPQIHSPADRRTK